MAPWRLPRPPIVMTARPVRPRSSPAQRRHASVVDGEQERGEPGQGTGDEQRDHRQPADRHAEQPHHLRVAGEGPHRRSPPRPAHEAVGGDQHDGGHHQADQVGDRDEEAPELEVGVGHDERDGLRPSSDPRICTHGVPDDQGVADGGDRRRDRSVVPGGPEAHVVGERRQEGAHHDGVGGGQPDRGSRGGQHQRHQPRRHEHLAVSQREEAHHPENQGVAQAEQGVVRPEEQPVEERLDLGHAPPLPAGGARRMTTAVRRLVRTVYSRTVNRPSDRLRRR